MIKNNKACQQYDFIKQRRRGTNKVDILRQRERERRQIEKSVTREIEYVARQPTD